MHAAARGRSHQQSVVSTQLCNVLTARAALFLRAYSLERKVTRGPKGDVLPADKIAPSGGPSQTDIEAGPDAEKTVEPVAAA